MRRRFTSRATAVASALTLLFALAGTAPPASAADRTTAPKASFSTSLAAKVAGLKPTPRAFQAATPATTTTATEGGSFLSSTTGKIAIVAMAAGLGYAAYSAFHDNNPVHSPIR